MFGHPPLYPPEVWRVNPLPLREGSLTLDTLLLAAGWFIHLLPTLHTEAVSAEKRVGTFSWPLAIPPCSGKGGICRYSAVNYSAECREVGKREASHVFPGHEHNLLSIFQP